jgi:hypothetical protein
VSPKPSVNRQESKAEGRTTAEPAEKSEGTAAAAFRDIGFEKPFGHKRFQQVFLELYPAKRPTEFLTAVMEATIQECQRRKIGVPPQFYDAKRDVEARENAMVRRAVPL